MCLTNLTTTEPKIATKNIFCWKRLRSKRESTAQGYRYKIGSKQKNTVNISIDLVFGYINEGYHSWINKESPANYLFVIPKGEKYFEGKVNWGEEGYVSSNIICLGHTNNPLTYLRKFYYTYKNKN